ncbi:hypothetical protein ASPCAL08419 [Aspergillus calidoustus]|uniref:Cytochrome b5 heme-binding domain-containing protein n=1 Tax=Aspergillus calidoustus TaxID=454130 RepID=A0A0U5GT90_ASPCI|nr:hypothetical protein ASPCAL08419 [Aspergillus calidoustus]
MGWVGVAVLVATTCFLLYRHPPASWFPEPPPADQARREPRLEEKAFPQASKDEERLTSLTEETRRPEAENEPIDDSQTTPKASAATPANLKIPSFQLNDDNTNGSATQKAQQDTPRITAEPSKTSSGTIAPSTPSIPTVAETKPSSTMQIPAAKEASLMPPPPPPSRLHAPVPQRQPQSQQKSTLAPPAGRFPPQLGGRPSSSMLSPPPSAAASLRVPPGGRPTSTSSSLAPTKVTLKPPKNGTVRPVLEPGFSPLDWAALTSNPNNKLRGENLPSTYIKVTPSMLKAQNGRKGTDAWTSYQGKVYNITPYLPYHPGGKGELLRGAGKDSGKLFLEIHPWVNWDAILGACLVGILVSENEALEPNKLDEMD